jgi:hypothetical protein
MVDLIVDTGIEDLHQKWPGRLLRRLLPGYSESFFLEVDLNLIQERRPEVIYDKTYIKRYMLYKRLFKDFKFNFINNNLSVEASVNNILKKVSFK